MRLEALEFVERRQIRIVVVEMDDETDRHLVVVVMVEERAAAGRIVERPAERMLDQAFLVFCGIDLPDFLQPDAEFRRLAVGVEREFRDQLLAQAATRAFGGQSASSRQSGINLSRETGSITAPDRICAPTSEPFSTTTMLRSALSCFSRIAAARPDGPAPTITTSNSMDSRGGSSSALMI